MINCSRLTPTSEETRSWHPNNDSTRGRAFNARTAQGRYLRSTSRAQMPRPLGLGQLVPPKEQASPNGTRPPCSLLLQRNKPRPMGLVHLAACSSKGTSLAQWDSTTLQLAPPQEQASPNGTRPPCSLLLQRNKPRPIGLGHFAACSSRGTSLAQVPRSRPPNKSRPTTHINIRPGPCGTHFTPRI
ncbi:hypothetical protein Adt_42462 [Abeliophyllum distichum]|uniref:Uncharacterized protein n=1 Tax=Abeliophyllum distichum TaxID=126358 RepID=A0ABD1PRQ9_9LAMI